MQESNRLKNFILIPLLIISLVGFNFYPFLVFAEGDGVVTEGVVIENNEDTQIVTGDSNTEVNLENTVNSNLTELNGDDSSDGESEPLENLECEEIDVTTSSTDVVFNIANDNEAEVENNIETEEETGDNEIDQSEGDAIIDTGDINLVVGVVNTVNTNVTGSDFSQLLLNVFENLEEDIDLSDQLMGISSLENCYSPMECFDLNIVNDNQGSIENNILVDASTGENTAQSIDGDAIIKTGNANVAVNALNILNTDIIGSNWTQLIINVFDNWTGDLVFPGKGKMQGFLNQKPRSCEGDCGDTNIVNSNEGEIENKVHVQANTGENQSNGNSSIIRTGQANAEVNLLNIANTNLYDKNWFFVGINNFGNWKGNVFSLPPGLEMSGDSNSVQIYNLELEDVNNPTEDFDNNTSGNSLNIVNENTGIIKNNIIVNLSTGENSAISSNGQTTIETGDANTLTNIANLLNSNIVGSNWLLGTVNILGDWNGDLAFGRPDNWIGGSVASSHNPVSPGETITYTLTYINNGDADATQVMIIDDYDEAHLSIIDTGGGIIIDNPGEIQWDIGTIAVGGSGSVSYSAVIDPEVPYGTTYLTNQATIDSFEEDFNNEDNIEILSIEVYRPLPVASVMLGFSSPSSSPKLEISKTHNVDDFVYSGSDVDFKIVLYNDSDSSAYDVVVYDTLRNDASEAISTSHWDLGEVFPHEEIIIDYTAAIGSEFPAGFYTNIAEALGFDSQGNPVSSPEASSTIEVRAAEVPPDETEEVEEISLEEIEKELKEMKDKIRKIREEIERLSHPSPVEEFTSSLPKQLISEVLAAEEPFVPKEKINLPERGLAPLLLASLREIGGTDWMMILAIFCLIGLIIIGIREWELIRKKKKR